MSLCQRQPSLERRQSFFPDQLVVKILTSHRDQRACLLTSISSKQRTLFFSVTSLLTPAVWGENATNGACLLGYGLDIFVLVLLQSPRKKSR